MEENIVPLSDLIKYTIQEFEYTFGSSKPTVYSYAPGRVNIIGEHVDYNDGFVMPMAIPLYTVIVGCKNGSENCNIVTKSKEFKENPNVEFHINDIKKGSPQWANYVKGVLNYYPGSKNGFNAVINSTIPIGGGLSSSASLEVATLRFLQALDDNRPNLTLIKEALICQKAEHELAGVPCGIMDQFISIMAQEGHALLIDCETLECEFINFSSDDIVFLVTNSNVRHELSDSEYSSRREYCEKLAKMMMKKSLRAATCDELNQLNSDDIDKIRPFGLHAIKEIERTMKAGEAMKKNNLDELGKLMSQSHQSLRDLYKVSCRELEELVEAAIELGPGMVLGSRMTGGGFGGCTISLVKKDHIKQVMSNIREKYSINPTFYVFTPVAGAQFARI